MSFWDKLTGKSDPCSSTLPTQPIVRDIGTGEALATVYAHTIASKQSIPCWTYVTSGLAAFGQREMALTLCRERGESTFPEEPLKFFETILHLAKESRTVDNGGFTQLGVRRFFGRHLLYMFAWPIEGVEIAPGTLAILLITDDELEAVKNYGPLRVATRFGQRERYYPYPTWNTRATPARGAFVNDLTTSSTLLSNLPRLHASGVFVNQRGGKIIIQATAESGRRISEALNDQPADAPLALLTDLNPLSDGCLVWQPGQREPGAITPPNSTGQFLSGCFIAFVPGQESDEVRMHEDGFTLLIRNETWSNIRRAFEAQTELAFTPTTGDGTSLGFEMAWRTEKKSS